MTRKRSRWKHCPQCEADISDSYEERDPSVGITSGGWYCDMCELPVDDDPDESDFV